jgi:V8-like Glu-specific endopeptidase
MRSRLPAIVAMALLVGLTVPAVAGARSAQSAAQAEHARILAYWTPERIANAVPRDYERTSSGQLVPKARPGGSSGTGASWTGDGRIEQQSGRILFSTTQGDWICSGSVIDDGGTGNNRSVVLTAGHCVFDAGGGWSSNFMYIPDFDDGPNYTCNSAGQVYGCWTATRLGANADFVSGGGFGSDTLGVDYGFALMGLGGKTGSELDVTVGGSYPLKTSGQSNNDVQWAFGYPAAQKYHGLDLTYCTGTTIEDPNGAPTWGMACNMTGGSSGGPWLYSPGDPAVDNMPVSSLNSYGYRGLNYMFGPLFNGETTTVLGDVIDGSATSGITALH